MILERKVALDAVEAAIDRRVRVARVATTRPSGDTHQHAAAGAAVAADALVPVHAVVSPALSFGPRAAAGGG